MNNKLFCIFVAIFTIILLGVSITLNFTLFNKNKNKTNLLNEEKKELTVEEKGNKIDGLMVIGVELYNSGKYKEFQQTSDLMYYVTLGELKALGYTDVEKILINCSDDDRIIYFDDEHLSEYSSKMPVLARFDCSN